MALAVLALDDDGAGAAGVRFRGQIGRNRYYVYAAGRVEGDGRARGALLEPAFESRLQGPLPPELFGRIAFEIPRGRLGRDDRYVQLVSFRSADRRGPAVSEIVEIPLYAVGRETTSIRPGGALMMSAVDQEVPAAAPIVEIPAESVPFQIKERNGRSEAMFFGAIGSLISSALPMIGNLLGGGGGGGLGAIVSKVLPGLGNLLGSMGGAKPGEAAGGVMGEVQKLLADPKMQELLTNILNKAVEPPAKAQSLMQSRMLGRTSGRPPAPRRRQMSEAQIAPALLAALPALMPLLEKVLSPETVQAVLDQPAKLTGAVADGIAKVGGVAIDAAKVENDWLSKMNPGTDDSDIISLMKGFTPRPAVMAMGAPLAPVAGGEAAYRRVDSVELHFKAGPTENINGQTRVAYALGRDLGFELEITTPREIRDPVLELAIKEPESLKTVWRTRVRPGALRTGGLPRAVTVPAAALSRLPASEDYVVTATLVWKNRAGRAIGTSRTLNVTLVGPLAFDRLGPARPPVRLDDVEAFRSFWHKVWQQSFDEARRFELDCKYYVALDPGRDRNGRMESQVDLMETARTRRAGRLKSGLLVAPQDLTALARRLGGAPLSPEVCEALKTSELADHLSYAARTKVEFGPQHGGAGDSVALWVYPEVQLQEMVFKRARQVDERGRVLRFDEHTEAVPVPVAVHFVGVSTKGAVS